MPSPQVTDSEVYHTSTGMPLRPDKHLDHCATWVLVPFHNKCPSLPCSVGEYIQHSSHFFQVKSFRTVSQTAWSEGNCNRMDTLRAYWLDSKVYDQNAPNIVGCRDSSHLSCQEAAEIQSRL